MLVAYGDQDEFTGISSYTSLADDLRREAQGRDNLRIVQVDGANHFWVDDVARGRMLGVVQDWVP